MAVGDASPATVEEYARAARALFPDGIAWSREPNSNLHQLLRAQADSWGRVDRRAGELAREADPRTTLELLSDWERVLGLPDPCATLGASVGLRRKAVVAKLTGSHGGSPAGFIALAESLGWSATSITVSGHEAFRVGVSRVGDRLYGTDWLFAWRVTAPELNPTFFSAGHSAAGDPLVESDNEVLRCYLERYKPAHTVVVVDFTEPYNGYAPWRSIRPKPAIMRLVAPPPAVQKS